MSKNNFAHIQNIVNSFENEVSPNILESQEYRCNIAIVPMSVNKENKADYVYIVPPDSEMAKDVKNIILKSKLVDKATNYPYSFTEVIKKLKNYFIINNHILTNAIKENNIKRREEYSYKFTIGKNTVYKYSEQFLDFLRTKLEKIKTNKPKILTSNYLLLIKYLVGFIQIKKDITFAISFFYIEK